MTTRPTARPPAGAQSAERSIRAAGLSAPAAADGDSVSGVGGQTGLRPLAAVCDIRGG